MKRFLTLGVFLISVSTGSLFSSDADSIVWRSLGQDEGFSGAAVSSIIQDTQGLIWIGSAGGLYRYDGHGFRGFKPEPEDNAEAFSSITQVIEGPDGTIWAGSDGNGLGKYSVLSGVFEKIPVPGMRVSALSITADGGILAGTKDGVLWKKSPGAQSVVELARSGFLGKEITSILVDMEGSIWAGTAGAGLHRLDSAGTTLAVYRHDAADPGSIASDMVSAVIEDSLGFLWVGFSEGGIDLFEAGRFSHSSPAGKTDAAMPPVLTLAEDVKGQIWAGLRGVGIGVLDPSRMELAVSPFLEGAEVSTLFRDRRGLMWAGLERGGLRTGDYRSTAFSRFSQTADERSLGSIRMIAGTAEGELLVLSRSAGLLRYDPRSESFRTESMLASEVMEPASDGSLWMGDAMGSLTRRTADGTVRTYRPASGSAILSLLESGEGLVWIGTDGRGLLLFDPSIGALAPPPPLPASIISCVVQDSAGRTWAGTSDAGLFVLDPGGSIFRSVGRGDRHGAGIGDLRIETVFEDSRGTIWVGTGGSGMISLDPETGLVLFRGKSAGLRADAVYGIAEDANGRLWAASSLGLFSLDPEGGDTFLFGREDGLLGGDLNAGAIAVSGSGEIWLGSGEGLTRFDPGRIARYAPAPDVVISDVVPMGGGNPIQRSPDGSEVTLAHDNRGLGFSISAIDFAASGRNQYAMRLEGRQTDWTSMGNVNTGYLAPLPPGHYILRVRAANGNGIWNRYGASLSINVKPPWWGTWWFRVLVIGLTVAGVASIGAAIVGSLKRRNALLVKFAHHIEEAREEERTIAARDVHDEIGQHLMVLNFHAYWLGNHLDAGTEERSSKVKEMQKAVLDAMASVKAVATRLRPLSFETLDFADALRWYVKSFGRMSGIKTRLELRDESRSIPPHYANAFFRILQEMLSNVARHSKATHVTVRFSVGEDNCTLEVSDDGVGIDAGKVKAQDSFGIIGMRERCSALGGTLDIQGTARNGCRVSARLPMNDEDIKGSGKNKGATTC